ncbi:MAG: hypothetical protein RL513_2038 [Pseudomonadota bacterium]
MAMSPVERRDDTAVGIELHPVGILPAGPARGGA